MIIVEDVGIERLLRLVLEHEDYRVCEAKTGRLGLEKAAERRPDVIVLGLDFQDISGFMVLQSLREWSQVPVLVLSDRTGADDKVRALDGGADDYLTVPFDSGELLARLRVMQRSAFGVPDGPLLIEGDLKADLATHNFTFKGRKLDLTPTEEAVFYLLVRYAGKIVTCKHLVRAVWGADGESKIHELQVYIARLREKLTHGENEIVINTEGNLGYRLAMITGQPDISA